MDVKDWKTDELYDIIIDDGSHSYTDALFVVKNFQKNLKPGGLMVIEDIQDTRLWNGYNLIRCGENYDDVLLTINV